MDLWSFPTVFLLLGIILATHVQKSEQIVGGAEIFRGEYKSIVSIRVDGVHKCSGSILSHTTYRYVLTAASCVFDTEIQSLEVIAGEHSLSLDDGTEQFSGVQRIRVHNFFNPETVEDDVAVLQLSSNYTAGEFVGQLSIYTGTSHPSLGDTIGWGAGSFGGGLEDRPKKIEYSFFSDADCAKYHSNYVAGKMLCGGWQSGGEDVCTGDAGSIAYRSGNGWVGIVTGYDSTCGRQHMPGLYIRLKYYIPWVDLQIKQLQTLALTD